MFQGILTHYLYNLWSLSPIAQHGQLTRDLLKFPYLSFLLTKTEKSAFGLFYSVEAKDAECKKLLEKKDLDLEDMKKRLKDQEKESQNELLKLQMEVK